ncbi:esterase-like activity of phytase family protein [Phenylobacterium sp.]|uniref:esterase-like activity of phytase family protein n=1 Tax=Phenylobacterium sp. TaxID=1871053 RepID=UPI0035B3C521
MRRLAGPLGALALAGCVSPSPTLPPAPLPYAATIAVDAAAVPLDPTDPSRQAIGRFVYAGGLHLTSQQTARLHGLSDIKVRTDGRLVSASDQSDLLRARVVLDGSGRLIGVADAHLAALKDATGADLYAGGQREFDSEGVAELASGDLLVSFEQNDRVLRFPRDGGPPRPAPQPQIAYTFNKGMEGLAADPMSGPDAYRTAMEGSGQSFLCRLATGCTPSFHIDLEGLELTSLDMLPDGRMAVLLRGFSPLRGNSIKLKILDRQGRRIDGMEMARPLTVDNFEGLAAVPGPGGRIRFYLISDDNFGHFAGAPTDQRTLLLAFDWRP